MNAHTLPMGDAAMLLRTGRVGKSGSPEQMEIASWAAAQIAAIRERVAQTSDRAAVLGLIAEAEAILAMVRTQRTKYIPGPVVAAQQEWERLLVSARHHLGTEYPVPVCSVRPEPTVLRWAVEARRAVLIGQEASSQTKKFTVSSGTLYLAAKRAAGAPVWRLSAEWTGGTEYASAESAEYFGVGVLSPRSIVVCASRIDDARIGVTALARRRDTIEGVTSVVTVAPGGEPPLFFAPLKRLPPGWAGNCWTHRQDWRDFAHGSSPDNPEWELVRP